MTADGPHTTQASPLDRPHPGLAERPFFDLTVSLLRCVRDGDFDTLAVLCDDDFGIVDIDPAGANVPIRNRTEWEAWFRSLFRQLDDLGAVTDSEVLAYDAVEGTDLGYSVLEFRQSLTIDGLTATFDCITTIVWKRTTDGWREARWHGSVIARDIPDELAALAG
jgi:ketosteroid isomerase-like protein